MIPKGKLVQKKLNGEILKPREEKVSRKEQVCEWKKMV